jgi:hypothetical protein
LNGSTDWLRFFGAQVTACLVRQMMCQFDLPPSIRRFKSEAGSIFDLNHQGPDSIDLDRLTDMIAEAIETL